MRDNISLSHALRRLSFSLSLLIFNSTFLSIAWAVVEHIADPKLIGAKALFATHYHELTELEGKLPAVHNYCIAVKEQGEDIVFLRKIIPGGADKSYGIQVAKLAGVPGAVLARAREIADELAERDITKNAASIEVKQGGKAGDRAKSGKIDKDALNGQITMFGTEESEDAGITKTLRELNLSMMTPIDALNLLYKLQEQAKNK